MSTNLVTLDPQIANYMMPRQCDTPLCHTFYLFESKTQHRHAKTPFAMNTKPLPRTSSAGHKTILVAGDGFAGTTRARALERNVPEGWEVLLISEESYTTFNPMPAAVVGAAVFPEHVIAPVREMMLRAQFIMGRIQHIDSHLFAVG